MMGGWGASCSHGCRQPRRRLHSLCGPPPPPLLPPLAVALVGATWLVRRRRQAMAVKQGSKGDGGLSSSSTMSWMTSPSSILPSTNTSAKTQVGRAGPSAGPRARQCGAGGAAGRARYPRRLPACEVCASLAHLPSLCRSSQLPHSTHLRAGPSPSAMPPRRWAAGRRARRAAAAAAACP